MRTILVVSTFFAVIADVFVQLSEKAAGLTLLLRLPLLLGAFFIAVLIGAVVSHILLSLTQGTDLVADLIQDEPVEQLAN